MDTESEVDVFQRKALALTFVLGFVWLSTTLQWLYRAGPSATVTLQASLILLGIVIGATALAFGIKLKMRGLILTFSGWAAGGAAWLLTAARVGPRQRMTWITENMGSTFGSAIGYLVVAALFLLVGFLVLKFVMKRPLSGPATWACLSLALIAYEGLMWADLLNHGGVQ